MIFRCSSCGGNVVYSPKTHEMSCPYCGGANTHQQVEEGESTVMCINCGGEIPRKQFDASGKCPYCDTYVIYDERVSGEFRPNRILPFLVDKEEAKDKMKQAFKSCTFAPDDFLDEAKLKSMKGVYVPFFLYDYDAECDFEGEGIKKRVWRTGNTEHTETSYYLVKRDMEIDFEQIPVDASTAMDDSVMDLMEPYDYKQMEDFEPKYISGFYSEYYNESSSYYEPRAKLKAEGDANTILNQTLSGYDRVSSNRRIVNTQQKKVQYVLLPVWEYEYSYQDKKYVYHINGQSGKIIGKAPLSKKKLCAYSATLFGLLVSIGTLVIKIMEVI